MSTVGSKIDALHQLREDKRLLEESVKAKQAEIDAAENELMETMEAQGLMKSTGTKATVSISSSVQPSVEDWDALHAFIHKNKYFHLLERRVAVLAFREMMTMKGSVPGVVPFVKKKLNVRTV